MKDASNNVMIAFVIGIKKWAGRGTLLRMTKTNRVHRTFEEPFSCGWYHGLYCVTFRICDVVYRLPFPTWNLLQRRRNSHINSTFRFGLYQERSRHGRIGTILSKSYFRRYCNYCVHSFRCCCCSWRSWFCCSQF